MRSLAKPALLAGLLGLGVTAGVLRAGEPQVQPVPPPPKPAPEVRPVPPARVTPEDLLARDCPAQAVDAAAAAGPAKRRPVRDWLVARGCWAEQNTVGCG